MKYFFKFILFLLISCVLTISGLSDANGGNKFNKQLEELLNEVSSGQGLDYFKLPESNDYSSIPQDPNNPLSDEKVALGKLLYHETALLTTPKKNIGMHTGSCASCHHADAGFQAGRRQGIGEGGWGFGTSGENRTANSNYESDSIDVQPIRSPTTLNTAWQKVMLWNGQFGAKGVNVETEANWTTGTPKEKNHLGFEGLEIQAIAAHEVHRLGDITTSPVATNDTYKQMFDAAFPNMPENKRITLINSGLAMAAYERTLLANQAPFQKWLGGDKSAMSDEEIEGAILFFGKANCSNCHTGPALSSFGKVEFYALGMNELEGADIIGDVSGKPLAKGRGGFTGNIDDMYKFKIPQLYNLTNSPFYGHGASFSSVKEVIQYKNNAVQENNDVPKTQLASEFVSLNLTEEEIDLLVKFIEVSLYDANLKRYVPTSLPTGFCFPNNDDQAKSDLGCQQ